MKKTVLALITFIIIGMLIPAVSATYEEELTDSKIISEDYDCPNSGWGGAVDSGNFNLEFYQIEKYADINTVYVRTLDGSVPTFSNLTLAKQGDSRPQHVEFVESVSGKNIGYGTLTYNIFYDSNKIPKYVQYWVDFYEWDVTGLAGSKNIRVNLQADSPLRQYNVNYLRTAGVPNADKPITFGGVSWTGFYGYYIVNTKYEWSNIIRITDDELSLIRNNNHSILTIESGENVFTEQSYDDRHIRIFPPITWTVTNTIGNNFTGTYTGESSEPQSNTAVTVYIRNSQTNALIANAQINISASVNGTLHKVLNETAPSGIYSIELQPTGGGMPNPDFYRLVTTAEGYISVMPYMDFEVNGAPKIYMYLNPIAGAPEDENKTFIDFYVRDLTANPISGATVNFGGYTLITNNAGYAVLEVDKNNTYTWTVSKSGYGSLTGNAVIGSDGRHTINTVIAPAVTPTTPTTIPTSTSIIPNPTMTAPTGEPTSNWLEWFAAHFGMILGGGVEIGKIFMWLCFAVPVGVYVGKEAKAGAAGFMAGAGFVTLFFVIIGWVPIWLLVLLALIIGLLYAKVFNNSDTGGGR